MRKALFRKGGCGAKGNRELIGDDMLKSIRVKRVTEEIVAQIHRYIAQGELQAGDKLPSERTMAQQLGVSRPTLREALQVLEHTGFIRILHGSGAYIKDINKQLLTDPLQILVDGSDIRYGEVYEFRSAIECWAAGQAAERIAPSALDELTDIIERMKKRRKVKESVMELDTEFHLAIARACRNSIYYHILKTIVDLLIQVTNISHKSFFSSEADQITLMNDHIDIYEAIAARDAVKAREFMALHHSRILAKLLAASIPPNNQTRLSGQISAEQQDP